MDEHSGSWDRTAADDVLDYAMGISLLGTGLLTVVFISLGFPVVSTILGMSVIGGLWTFTVTPHLVAFWLGVDVDALLGIKKQDPIQLPRDDSDSDQTT